MAASDPTPEALPQRPSARRARLLRVMQIAVSVLLLWLLVHELRAGEFLAVAHRLAWWVWPAGTVLTLGGIWVSSLKLRLLMRAVGIDESLPRLMHVYLVSLFLGNWMPGTVGGDVFKFVYLHRPGRPRGELAAAILLERLTGLWLMLATALCLLPALPAFPARPWVLLVLLIGAAFALAPVPLARWHGRAGAGPARPGLTMRLLCWGPLVRVSAALALMLGSRRGLLGVLGISALFMLQVVLTYGLVACGLGVCIPPASMAAIVAVVQLAAAVPISLNGVGVREWALVALLALFGTPQADALLIGLVVYAIVLVVSLIGGLLLVLNPPRRAHTTRAIERAIHRIP